MREGGARKPNKRKRDSTHFHVRIASEIERFPFPVPAAPLPRWLREGPIGQSTINLSLISVVVPSAILVEVPTESCPRQIIETRGEVAQVGGLLFTRQPPLPNRLRYTAEPQKTAGRKNSYAVLFRDVPSSSLWTSIIVGTRNKAMTRQFCDSAEKTEVVP